MNIIPIVIGVALVVLLAGVVLACCVLRHYPTCGGYKPTFVEGKFIEVLMIHTRRVQNFEMHAWSSFMMLKKDKLIYQFGAKATFMCPLKYTLILKRVIKHLFLCN